MKTRILHTYDAECDKCQGICKYVASKPKHTPTPWSMEDDNFSESRFIVSDSNGYHIGIADMLPIVKKWDHFVALDRETIKANAAFIVRAVNSHEELLACLKSCRLTMNTAGMPVGHIDNAIASAEGK